jgi:hypothetical protein
VSSTGQPITVAIDAEALTKVRASTSAAAAAAARFGEHSSLATAAKLADEFGRHSSLATAAKLAEEFGSVAMAARLAEEFPTRSLQAAQRTAASLSAQMTERLAKSITAQMTEQLRALSDSALALSRASIAEAVSPVARIPAFPNLPPPVVRAGLEPTAADAGAPRSGVEPSPAAALKAYYVAYAFFVAEILNLAAALQTEQPLAVASAALLALLTFAALLALLDD